MVDEHMYQMPTERKLANDVKLDEIIKELPALQEAGGSFCRSFNSLLIRFEAMMNS